MIQFNLLPDVKLDYIKAEKQKRMVISLAFIVSAVAVAVLILLLTAGVLQKKHLSDLSRDIKSQTSALQNQPNINTILTVQNQLESLTNLHNAKPAAARLFTYLNSVTPSNVAISSLSIDFNLYTVTISGASDSISDVNKYVDTLKLTTYTTNTSSAALPAFSNVVLNSFGVSSGAKDASQSTTYNITFNYDKNIFDITQTISLSVPSITTHAQLSTPSDLFKAQTNGVTK